MAKFDNNSLDRWLFGVLGGADYPPAREAASRLKREQTRKQRAKMKAHNKRQKKLNKQHGRRQ